MTVTGVTLSPEGEIVSELETGVGSAAISSAFLVPSSEAT